MPLHLHVDTPLAAGQTLELPAAAARHVQVRRLQPGDALTLFNGHGGLWHAVVEHMGRTAVSVRLLQHEAASREPLRAVTLAVGMPANERMDWLVEKASELGALALQPLQCERSVLRLDAQRAAKRREHWQAVAVAAAEQSGATRVTRVLPVQTLSDWLALVGDGEERRIVLSLRAPPRATSGTAATPTDMGDALLILSGPEGGLTPAEEDAALARGFAPRRLGPRTLRAETAPLVALSLALAKL